MAALVKDSRRRSPFWICCYTAADGRRLKKTTKQTNRSKAQEICFALERAENLAAQGELTAARARRLIADVLERTGNEPLKSYSVKSWLDEWLTGKAVSRSEGTRVKYSHMVKELLGHLGQRATANIASITSGDIARFRDSQLASGKNPNTVKYLIKQVRIPFTAAKRAGIISVSPADSVDLPSAAKNASGNTASKEPFTNEHVTALVASAITIEKGRPVFENGEDWRRAILFAFHIGARLQDVANMKWNLVDDGAGVVRYRAAKTGSMVTIPVHPQLVTVLAEVEQRGIYIFPGLAGKSTSGRSGLSMAFKRIMERAGVVGKVMRKAEGKGRTVSTLSFHSLRHSFNSRMANAGVSQEVRMKLIGHSSTEMNNGYQVRSSPGRRTVCVPSVGASVSSQP